MLGFRSARRVFKRSVPRRRTWSGSFTPGQHVGAGHCFFSLKKKKTFHLSAYLRVDLDFASAYLEHDPSKAPGG